MLVEIVDEKKTDSKWEKQRKKIETKNDRLTMEDVALYPVYTDNRFDTLPPSQSGGVDLDEWVLNHIGLNSADKMELVKDLRKESKEENQFRKVKKCNKRKELRDRIYRKNRHYFKEDAETGTTRKQTDTDGPLLRPA